MDVKSAADDFGTPPFVDLSRYHQPGYEAGGSRVKMLVWWLVQAVIFPLTPHTAHGIRCWLLRLFGAKIGQQVMIRPTARFTYPWNVEIGDCSWVGDDAVLYSLAPIRLGRHCVISQKSYLCTGSHDISDPRFGLMTGEIVIENGVWVATDCFVGPAVRIGANAVIGARSTVLQPMPGGQVCLGTPCKPVKPRPMDQVADAGR
ncbi:hormogonium polysaccharide biosynthesis acetyltransferase HpsU [Leptolyngbya sp. BC1307]|uniref:hormogonium polysaccharide biosynthesis acetyltransferase HpsU n=1 Tax=Leptolyngbya sp. BC1307 TaxID=2029589 RepID=UPI000EFC7C1F|nr:hormogonium polysaccharide biosynthesis acetyltransferase HpsU [Leptolyngbya sp. BC1307]